MTARLIYLVGQPGSGKSTLMADLIHASGYVGVPAPSWVVPHTQLVNDITGAVVGAEIGKHRELFSGTDALASSIIDRAAPWVKTTPYPLLLAEGARLGNRRFIDAAIEGDYQVTLALLDHDDAEPWRKQRSKAIGKVQNPSWVKGRLSASRNLADALASPAYAERGVKVLRGHPKALMGRLLPLLSTDG